MNPEAMPETCKVIHTHLSQEWPGVLVLITQICDGPPAHWSSPSWPGWSVLEHAFPQTCHELETAKPELVLTPFSKMPFFIPA